LLLASFAIAMIGIIIAVTSAYDKDTTEAKEGAKKESRARQITAAAEIRIGLAAVSFYCDLSDPNNAHGFRTVNHFGGAKAQDALISMLEVGVKKFKT
jgi:hypothetical protein